MKLGDYMITEAGFGADLGAEKFFDIVCRYGEMKPDAVVVVASVRALKNHGGVGQGQLAQPNLQAVETGFANLEKQLENIKKFGVPPVVALNQFPSDTAEETEYIIQRCGEMGVEVALSQVWAKGGAGGIELAEKVIKAAEEPSDFRFLYPLELPVKEKIAAVCQEIYGADGVTYSAEANRTIATLRIWVMGLPICIAKTQYSLSDNPDLKGRPRGFRGMCARCAYQPELALLWHSRHIMTMPGLGKTPAAETIDIKDNGEIVGLF